jgi:hypothetical protein
MTPTEPGLDIGNAQRGFPKEGHMPAEGEKRGKTLNGAPRFVNVGRVRVVRPPGAAQVMRVPVAGALATAARHG